MCVGFHELLRLTCLTWSIAKPLCEATADGVGLRGQGRPVRKLEVVRHAQQENPPPPSPSPASGEGIIREWPVERTARAAQGQTDGLLSDVNFGEVLPFVAKPLVKDFLARYVGPLLGS